jgi:ketosteroid isomerase-like protein
MNASPQATNAGGEIVEWVMSYYKAIDAGDIDTAIQFFAPNARVRFGNADFVVGRDAIHQDLGSKSASFRSLTHHFNNIWDVGDGVIVLDADIDFVRLDGVTVRAYGAGLFRHRDRQWTEQLHYVDLSEVFGVS